MSDETTNHSSTDTRPAGQSPSGSGAFTAVLIGGFLAGAIGFLAAYYTEFGLFQTGGNEAVTELRQTVEAQTDRLAELESRIDDAGAANQDAIDGRLSDLSARLDQLETGGQDQAAAADRIATLEEQVAQLAVQTGEQAARITDNSQAEQIAVLTRQIEDLTARIEDQASTLQSQATAIEQAGAAATAEANRVSAQAALSGIEAALSTGDPYADEIGALRSATEASVPDPLAGAAETGVATLGSLQDSFDAAARAALSESVAATAGGGVTDRLGAFLRAQTNARSLNERQGESADAVLSRAEARLREGNLQAALDEISALPEEGQAAMSDWLDRARTRLEALNAFSELSDSVNAN